MQEKGKNITMRKEKKKSRHSDFKDLYTIDKALSVNPKMNIIPFFLLSSFLENIYEPYATFHLLGKPKSKNCAISEVRTVQIPVAR